MAYPISANDVIEGVLWQLYDGQYLLTNFHWRVITGSTLDGSAWLSDFNDQVNGSETADDIVLAMRGAQSEAVAYNRFTLQKIASTRWAKRTFTPSKAGGGRTGDAISTSTALAITKQSDEPRPRGVGTLHLGGLLATDPVDSLWGVPARTAITDLLATLTRQITVGTLTVAPVIYNRASPGLSPIITSTIGQPEVRTMRRRVVGRGI